MNVVLLKRATQRELLWLQTWAHIPNWEFLVNTKNTVAFNWVSPCDRRIIKTSFKETMRKKTRWHSPYVPNQDCLSEVIKDH